MPVTFSSTSTENEPIKAKNITYKAKPWLSDYESREKSVVDHPYAMPAVIPVLNKLSELAKFNNISQQFSVERETGPSHSKTFFVKLELGKEEFIGEGRSINDAKKNAAAVALANSTLPLPATKEKTVTTRQKYKNILKEVLVILRMENMRFKKHKLPSKIPHPSFPETSFVPVALPMPLIPQSSTNPMLVPQVRTIETTRLVKLIIPPELFNAPTGDFYYQATLFIGNEEIHNGYGDTLDEAKEEACMIMISRLMSEMVSVRERLIIENDIESRGATSRLHEMCAFLKLNLSEIIVYSGTGEGLQKKKALSDACETVLVEFGSELEFNPFYIAQDLIRIYKKKCANLVKKTEKRNNLSKERKLHISYSDDMNPIAHLQTIVLMKEKSKPDRKRIEYITNTVLESTPTTNFVTTAIYREFTTQGTAQSKKLSKRYAAEHMLALLGYARQMPEPKKSLLKKMSENGSVRTERDEVDGLEDFESVQPAVVDPVESSNVVEKMVDKRVKFSSRVEACPSPSDKNYPQSETLKLKLDSIDEGKSRIRKESSSKRTLCKEQIAKLHAVTSAHLAKLESGAKLEYAGHETSAKELLTQVATAFRFSVNYTNLPQNVSCFALCTVGLDDNIVVNGEGNTSAEAESCAAFNALTVLNKYSWKNKENSSFK